MHRLLIAVWFACLLCAQGTLGDYQRAADLRKRYEAAALHVPEPARWTGPGRFWYRRSVGGGHEFVVVDAATREKKAAFDHDRLAVSLSAASSEKLTGVTLPATLELVDKETAVEVNIGESRYRCALSDYNCKRTGIASNVFARNRPQAEVQPLASPDGKHHATVRNFNVAVDGTLLSSDGSEGNYYDPRTLAWSPDSKKLAAYRVRPGYKRKVNYVESSPADQLQPKLMTIDYAKPGDVVDL